MNRKKIILTVGAMTLGWGLFQPSILAESKKQLAHLVMEHEQKIAHLEELVMAEDHAPEAEVISANVKESLLKEIDFRLPEILRSASSNGEEVRISGYDIIEGNDGVILQFYTEGEYDWGQAPRETWEGTWMTYGTGRAFATTVIQQLDNVFKLYGVSQLTYEFYQNGEKVEFTF